MAVSGVQYNLFYPWIRPSPVNFMPYQELESLIRPRVAREHGGQFQQDQQASLRLEKELGLIRSRLSYGITRLSQAMSYHRIGSPGLYCIRSNVNIPIYTLYTYGVCYTYCAHYCLTITRSSNKLFILFSIGRGQEKHRSQKLVYCIIIIIYN